MSKWIHKCIYTFQSIEGETSDKSLILKKLTLGFCVCFFPFLSQTFPFACLPFCCLRLPVFSGYLDSHTDITHCGSECFCFLAVCNCFRADRAGLGSQEMWGLHCGPQGCVIRLPFEYGEGSKGSREHLAVCVVGGGRKEGGCYWLLHSGWGDRLHVCSLLSCQLTVKMMAN